MIHKRTHRPCAFLVIPIRFWLETLSSKTMRIARCLLDHTRSKSLNILIERSLEYTHFRTWINLENLEQILVVSGIWIREPHLPCEIHANSFIQTSVVSVSNITQNETIRDCIPSVQCEKCLSRVIKSRTFWCYVARRSAQNPGTLWCFHEGEDGLINKPGVI